MIYDRTFGVEIEAYAPRGLSFEAVRDAILQEGVNIYHSYSHNGRADAQLWVIKPDGSLMGQGTGNGMEIVSRHLRGEEGMTEIRKACGLHVHVQQPSVGGMRRLAIDYAIHEEIIDSVLPHSRRGSSCRWAGTLKSRPQLSFAQARTSMRIADVVGHGKYAKINFTASSLHGTVEFRQHSGTIDADKIINWSKLCLRLVDHADANPVALAAGGEAYAPRVTQPLTLTSRRFRRTSRGRTFVQLLTRQEGATRDEIFAATGWDRGSLSMTRFAREAGLVLRSQRLMSGSRRYWGTFAEAPIPAPPSPPPVTVEFVPVAPAANLAELGLLLGMDFDEVAYFMGRRDHFARSQPSVNE